MLGGMGVKRDGYRNEMQGKEVMRTNQQMSMKGEGEGKDEDEDEKMNGWLNVKGPWNEKMYM